MTAIDRIREALATLDQAVGALTHAQEDFKEVSNSFMAAAKTVADGSGTGAVLSARAVTLAEAVEGLTGRAEQLATDGEAWYNRLHQ